MNDRRASIAVFFLGFAACTAAPPSDPGDTAATSSALRRSERRDRGDDRSWLQWGQNPRHTAAPRVAGQPFTRQLADIVYDPLAPDEVDKGFGELRVHYQAPLVDGADVYMMRKTGTFDPTTFSTQIWSEAKLAWVHDELVQQWNFVTDWVAPGNMFDFHEPVFHPVIANGYLYVPGKGGTIHEVDRKTGVSRRRISPFSDDGDAPVDSHKFTVSPITADEEGNLYFNVIEMEDDTVTRDFFLDQKAVDSWLVKVYRDGRVAKVSYRTLTPGAPAEGETCEGNNFGSAPLPWPPSPTSFPAAITCTAQRVALNVAPAVDRDGTIYTVSHGHFSFQFAYLIAVNPDLTPKWNASLRHRFSDGCGVPPSEGGSLPPNGAPGGCREGALRGVDPNNNRPGNGIVLDASSATPAIAPDGSVFFGTFGNYNYSQGHLVHFSREGEYLGEYPFGWDMTPAIYAHDGTYSLVVKDNHYSGPSYCVDDTFCPPDRTATNPASPEAYFITQLSPSLKVEWQIRSTNTDSCQRDGSGHVTCTSDHPAGFEWCVNMPAVDGDGVVYVNSEDGFLYAIRQGGALKDRVFQQLALGAAYTPASLGPDGKIYSQNAGHLFVMGR